MNTFNFTQSTPAATWTIVHNLGTKPVHDAHITYGGVVTKIIPAGVEHVDDNTLVLTFSSAQSGTARLAGGAGAPLVLNGSVIPEAPWTPVAPSGPTWTQSGDYWSIAGNVATSPSATLGSVVSGSWTEDGDTLHGALLPAGNYADVWISDGYTGSTTNGQNVPILGVSDFNGPLVVDPPDATNRFVVWYWNGQMFREGTFTPIATAPSGATGPQRYRIASKTGGEIVMSKVSSDGTTLQGTSVSVTMTAGFNPSTLHIVLIGQSTPGNGYAAPSATAYDVQTGSGGL